MAALQVVSCMWRSRWIVALASFLLMVSSGGALNTFSLFSQHLKVSLEYEQKDMNTISFFKDVGTSVGILSGLVYDLTGPWVVLLLGFALNLFGYLMIWLSTTQRIAHPEVWQMCIYLCIIGASAAFTTTAVLVACAKNFPRNQGMILSLLDSTQGLSAAIFTFLYQVLYANNKANSFILMLAWFPALLCLLFMFLIRSVPQYGKYNDKKILYTFLLATLGLAGYLMLVIILQHFLEINMAVLKGLFSIMLLILCIPIGVVLASEFKNATYQRKSHPVDTESTPSNSPPSTTNTPPPPPQLANSSSPERGDDFTIFQALFSIDMLLIFIATTCGVGAVLTVTNNLGQIGTSLGYSESGTNTFIALLSIWDFVGGVGCGFLSDICLVKYGIARPYFFAIVLLLLAAGNLVMALGLPGALFYGSILVGLSIGGQWSVLYTMIAELFGLKFYGTLQNITYVAKALGTYVLSVRIAGVLYDREARKAGARNSSTNELLCHGAHCYRTAFFVMAAACAFACAVSLLLSMRTSRFYKSVLRERLRSESEEDHPTAAHEKAAMCSALLIARPKRVFGKPWLPKTQKSDSFPI